MTADIRVAVADDQTTVREGLVALLELVPGIQPTLQARDGVELLEQLDAAAAVDDVDVVNVVDVVDVVLMDLRMPGMDGVAATEAIVRRHPDVAVVVISSYANDEAVVAALAAGARGYLTKDAGRREIAEAVRAAAAGLTAMDPVLQARLVHHVRTGQVPEQLPDGLTRREAQTLALIAAGLGNREIAARMRISQATVKTHINRAFAKAGVTTRDAAAAYARDHDLVPLMEPGYEGSGR